MNNLLYNGQKSQGVKQETVTNPGINNTKKLIASFTGVQEWQREKLSEPKFLAGHNREHREMDCIS